MTYPPYGDLPSPYTDPETATYVLLPVPYDATSTWMKGADRGPRALLEASAHMELYDIETDSEAFRKGIHTAPALEVRNLPPEKMVLQVKNAVAEWLARNKTVVTVGGEHSVAIGAFYAHQERWPGLSVLQLDAHADLRDQYEGSPFNHACVMARIMEKAPATQVGIRSMDISERAKMDPQRTFWACDIHPGKNWIEQVVGSLGPLVYITLDLDVLDPGIFPSTGTPEPGGLDWYTLLSLLKKVIAEKEVVGFDITELAPNPSNKAPDFLAAKLIYKILSYHNAYRK